MKDFCGGEQRGGQADRGRPGVPSLIPTALLPTAHLQCGPGQFPAAAAGHGEPGVQQQPGGLHLPVERGRHQAPHAGQRQSPQSGELKIHYTSRLR